MPVEKIILDLEFPQKCVKRITNLTVQKMAEILLRMYENLKMILNAASNVPQGPFQTSDIRCINCGVQWPFNCIVILQSWQFRQFNKNSRENTEESVTKLTFLHSLREWSQTHLMRNIRECCRKYSIGFTKNNKMKPKLTIMGKQKKRGKLDETADDITLYHWRSHHEQCRSCDMVRWRQRKHKCPKHWQFHHDCQRRRIFLN
jgi:hypothetical protein